MEEELKATEALKLDNQRLKVEDQNTQVVRNQNVEIPHISEPVSVAEDTPKAAPAKAAKRAPVADSSAPMCYNCGNQTQKAGSCYVCTSCGSTTGCS